MENQGIIEQLVGTSTGWDQSGDLTFVLYGCSKFSGSDCNVDLETGVVEVLSADGTAVTQKFAIKTSLEPLPL